MRAVIFDIGSVLIGWKPRLMYQKLVPDPELREWFLAEVSRAPWDEEPVRDGAFEEGLRRLAAVSPFRAEAMAQLHDRVRDEMINTQMPWMARLLERLTGEGVRLFGFTDLSSRVLTQVRQAYPDTLDQLAEIFLAEKVGLEQVLRRIGMRADQCLYVDESEVTIRAAESVGIPSILYTSIGPVRRELRERGFLPPSPWQINPPPPEQA